MRCSNGRLWARCTSPEGSCCRWRAGERPSDGTITHCNTRTERGVGSSQATHFPLEPLQEELLDEEAAPPSPATPATPAKGKTGPGKSPLRRHVSAGPGTLLGRPPTQRERQLTKTEMTRRKSVLTGGGGGMAGGKLAEAAAAEQERAEGGQGDAQPRGATPLSRKAKQKEARRETVAGQVG